MPPAALLSLWVFLHRELSQDTCRLSPSSPAEQAPLLASPGPTVPLCPGQGNWNKETLPHVSPPAWGRLVEGFSACHLIIVVPVPNTWLVTGAQ